MNQDQGEDDSKIKLKNVKQKWREGGAEEDEKAKEESKATPPTPAELTIKNPFDKGQPANPLAPPPSKKEEKKVNKKLEENKGLFMGMGTTKAKDDESDDSEDSPKEAKKDKTPASQPAEMVDLASN
jgi:hypothetical protein